MAESLGLNESECTSESFLRLFSGDVGEVPGFDATWATPYALSIYGAEQVANGAGEKGDGYGDGRAISIAEILSPGGERWELQLKGSGPTPFCRGSDGRAVLRSSVREFLVSEAMHHMGVPTTRALSLVASGSETVRRPWYTKVEEGQRVEKHGGDVMQEELVAMTTRVAPSFLRVGHFDLFARRARSGDLRGRQQLEMLARHALFREYPHLLNSDDSLQRQLLSMLSEAREKFASLAAEWLRVGYVQSNFNADNCLISGLTIDYGPFGFVEKYDPQWGMWIHAGQHFAFMNQPKASFMNFKTFAESVAELLDEAGRREVQSLLDGWADAERDALGHMWSRKLGLGGNSKKMASRLWSGAEKLMRRHPTDYTMLFWELAETLSEHGFDVAAVPEDSLLSALEVAFYDPLPSELRRQWAHWIKQWVATLAAQGDNLRTVVSAMRQANPRYVPREELLVEAYTAAQLGDHAPLRDLQELFRRPYEEQPGIGERYYRRRANGAERQGGVGFMS